MDNSDLANKLTALFPIGDLDTRVALVSVLKSVLNAGTNGPRQRFAFSEDEDEYLPFFIKELLAQPQLMEALFPGRHPKDVRTEFSGLTADGNPLMREIYSMLAKNILLDDLDTLSDAQLVSQADMISTPVKRQFIWQMLTQKDANEIIQRTEETIDLKRELSPISALTEEDSYTGGDDSENTQGLYDPKSSTFSPIVHSTDIKFPALRECINKDGGISENALSLLIYSGINQKVTRAEEKNSIDTLRFIYSELQKNLNERIPEFQRITEDATGAVIDKRAEEKICKDVTQKLQRYFGVGVENMKAAKSSPSKSYSQRYKKTVASRHDESYQSDATTHVSGYKSTKH
jgi:hypothetical protein